MGAGCLQRIPRPNFEINNHYDRRHAILKLQLRIIIDFLAISFSPSIRPIFGKRLNRVMKDPIRIGMTGEERITVGPSHVIVFADDRMPAVLSTPWVVAHLEYAARKAIAPCLEEHERSVGTYIEVQHLAPTPVGFDVVCQARVIHVQGPVVGFQVEARDGAEVIAKGIHRRRVIDVDRFRKRLERKTKLKGPQASA